MESTKYLHSLNQTLFIAILALGMTSFAVFMLMSFAKDYHVWLILGPFFLLLAGFDVYYYRKHLSPLLKGQAAVELDKEKLQSFIANKTIYWKNVNNIEYETSVRGDWAIVFVMIDGSDDIRISTQYVAGNDQNIYDTIIEYFEKYG